jgi:xylan 1,4-beta-xylosidase
VNKKIICLALLVAAFHQVKAARTLAEDATNSPRARTYQNPLISGQMMADPDVLEIDGTYYLYGTTHGQGYDVYVSTNLVDWKNKGRAFDDPLGGAWAPDLYHHTDGKIYLYYTDNQDERVHKTRMKRGGGPPAKQIGVAVADSPYGPFANRAVLASDAIDAHLFRDDDGRLYLYYVSIADGFKILVRPMEDPLTPRGDPVFVIRPTEAWERKSGEVTEGPFMLKHKNQYYLMYSGTGADSADYAIGYATSKSPLGPFTKYPGNPIAHRTESVLGPGHHCVVEGPDGDLWMVYHQKRDAEQSYRRFLALDRLGFDDHGEIHVRVTRDSDQAAPVKAPSSQR